MSDVKVRMAAVEETPLLRILYKECHPDWPARPPGWYFCNPTLVALNGEGIVGFTSLCINIVPGHGQVMYGQDVCVHPAHRGTGLGKMLHAARLDLAYKVGARVFM